MTSGKYQPALIGSGAGGLQNRSFLQYVRVWTPCEQVLAGAGRAIESPDGACARGREDQPLDDSTFAALYDAGRALSAV